MTRREFLRTTAAAFTSTGLPSRVVVPVHRIMDAREACTPEQVQRFWWRTWPEAVRDLSRGGIELQTTDGPGEIRRTAADNAFFIGLQRGVINLVLTRHIPLYWDAGRALAGVTTIRDGYHVCMVALPYAHENRVPFLSVNTCVHELLHALLGDVFVSRPKWYQSDRREFRIDWYATRLWLLHDGTAIRKSAQEYLSRLRSGDGSSRE